MEHFEEFEKLVQNKHSQNYSGINPESQNSRVEVTQNIRYKCVTLGNAPAENLVVVPRFVDGDTVRSLRAYLCGLRPIWEERYAPNHPPPPGEWQRRLKRPVYWLGNWQFACLDYYHPPAGTKNRCVRAEAYPASLSRVVDRIERLVRSRMTVPAGWSLNTCLVNYYGRARCADRWVDVAAVGEHRDYEPGPVASLSFGASALFQFVESSRRGSRHRIVWQYWLHDGELQAFGGEYWKKRVFHRIQRVKRSGELFPVEIPDFEVRRINLTFRYVPESDIVDVGSLPAPDREDILPYIEQLAKSSEHFNTALRALGAPSKGVS